MKEIQTRVATVGELRRALESLPDGWAIGNGDLCVIETLSGGSIDDVAVLPVVAGYITHHDGDGMPTTERCRAIERWQCRLCLEMVNVRSSEHGCPTEKLVHMARRRLAANGDESPFYSNLGDILHGRIK